MAHAVFPLQPDPRIGFYEYFLLCELIGAKPLPVLNVGLACQFQSYELVEMDEPEFQEFCRMRLT